MIEAGNSEVVLFILWGENIAPSRFRNSYFWSFCSWTLFQSSIVPSYLRSFVTEVAWKSNRGLKHQRFAWPLVRLIIPFYICSVIIRCNWNHNRKNIWNRHPCNGELWTSRNVCRRTSRRGNCEGPCSYFEEYSEQYSEEVEEKEQDFYERENGCSDHEAHPTADLS